MAKINLPHLRSSEAGVNMYEPIVGSQFMLYLVPPAGVTGSVVLTEHVKSITGMFDEPGGEGITEQVYQTSKRSYDSNEKNTTRNVDVIFTLNLNDANQNYVYNTMKQWSRLRYNPETGERGLKRNYTGAIVGIRYNRDGSIFWERTLHQCFVASNFPDLPADYGQNDAQELTVTFRSDWWQDA